MPQVRDALDALERIAPKRFAFSFDKVGLQVGDPLAQLTRGVVSLDRSLGAVRYAAENGAQMLVSHHPLIFEPLATVLQTGHVGRTVLELARSGIAFAAAHTNWDSAPGGINDALATIFELADVTSFGSAGEVKRLKLIAFCPPDAVERVIDAASEAGAGVIGDYSRCAFMIPGTGTFLGGEDTNPAVGEPGKVEHVDEVRVELALPVDSMVAVARAVRKAHPYEEPAYDFMPLVSEDEQPAGRVGTLPQAVTLAELLNHANRTLDTASWAWGEPSRKIRKLALVGGAADTEWRKARNTGADALLTGEVKQHVGLEAVEEGFAILACGHYATEQPGCAALRERLATELPDVSWDLYVPEKGQAGRPLP